VLIMAENEMAVVDELKGPTQLGEVFANSGLFSDIKKASQAVVKIMAGKELGLTPFQSMASIYIVNGKLALTSGAMSSRVKKSKRYDYVVTKLDETECQIDFFDLSQKDERVKIGTSIFTVKDAARCGLANKETFKSYPKNMLFARALSNGARFYCPDAICGYYEESELYDMAPAEPTKTTVTIDTTGEVKNA